MVLCSSWDNFVILPYRSIFNCQYHHDFTQPKSPRIFYISISHLQSAAESSHAIILSSQCFLLLAAKLEKKNKIKSCSYGFRHFLFFPQGHHCRGWVLRTGNGMSIKTRVKVRWLCYLWPRCRFWWDVASKQVYYWLSSHLFRTDNAAADLRFSDPGCGVDIPAAFYSLSFAPNPDFSNLFPKRDEVLQYINNVVMEYDLSRHLVGYTEWIGASWQDNDNTWLVSLRSVTTGEEYTQRCNILISAVGALTNPNPLNVPGIDRFQGDIIHTARWDQSVSLRDKNVIVLGNGGKLYLAPAWKINDWHRLASATQLVPAVAEDVRSITQFMRVSSLSRCSCRVNF